MVQVAHLWYRTYYIVHNDLPKDTLRTCYLMIHAKDSGPSTKICVGRDGGNKSFKRPKNKELQVISKRLPPGGLSSALTYLFFIVYLPPTCTRGNTPIQKWVGGPLL